MYAATNRRGKLHRAGARHLKAVLYVSKRFFPHLIFIKYYIKLHRIFE